MLVFALVFLAFFIGASVVKAQDTVIDMHDIEEGDLVVDGFVLPAKTTISIHAIGAELRNSDDMYACGWILDAVTRESVWNLNDQDTEDFRGKRSIREYEDKVTLPAGKYEVYYFAGRPYYNSMNITINNLDEVMDILGVIFDGDKEKGYEYYSENVEDLMFEIKASAGSFSKFNPAAEVHRKAIIEFPQPGDNDSEKKGFSLKKDMTLKIVAIGEYYSSERVFVDYGWIVDARTRKKVWQMDKWNTSWAGGARKNRSFMGEVPLPAGDYIAYYVSDDSHSFGDWNEMPPYDPLHWGMFIYSANESDIEYSAEFLDDYSEPVIVQISRVGDNDYKYTGFTLKKPADVHIVALGEYGYNDAFVDYGWIENLDDGEVIWEMTEDNTEHAGGAAKNRRFDGTVSLPAGNYMVYYVSDDSHSYRNWNSTAPVDQKMWGVTVFGLGKDFDKGSVVTFEEPIENKNVLVNLTGIGDDEKVRQVFELKSPQKVHIFALGEGRDGEMYDYGWIDDAETGETVWEMTYRMTRHGGGDRKNRMVDTDIQLEAGRYRAFFTTDDSHSFPDFNASRPDQPQKWGITITKK